MLCLMARWVSDTDTQYCSLNFLDYLTPLLLDELHPRNGTGALCTLLYLSLNLENVTDLSSEIG